MSLLSISRSRKCTLLDKAFASSKYELHVLLLSVKVTWLHFCALTFIFLLDRRCCKCREVGEGTGEEEKMALPVKEDIWVLG